ncbi:hypothetical protein CAPTEDRAFT_159180 [Capitella teleta]|uniref:Transcription elongation factor Eaf N-terminal domain-containing protein n=1 Tax=Capitella teleta TaxID=283909 RepID=R7TY20_CAPTE|nr:hypothetical protein CAPTEDRAFT_159180 [Capitella teleta]|eukprot:ELT98537.1 hypothetical protein CAPTEDRAFT_159180 [Capitella teleta]
MADKIGIHDSDIHELKLGGSFAKDNSVAFHSIRYDFKPASVDTTRAANVSVGKGSSVTVEVPHVEGSGTSHTVFKGNKRPCQKECVLIIDHTTGEITLERLASDIRLKKTRLENSSRAAQQAGRPLTPVETKVKPPSPPKRKEEKKTNEIVKEISPPHMPPVEEMADSDMSLATDSDDSDSDKASGSIVLLNDTPHSIFAPTVPVSSSGERPPFLSTLSEDLHLSDTSGSDSD